MDKLKPCPFCGNAHVYTVTHHFHISKSMYGVRCPECRAQGYQYYPSEQEAVEAWNERTEERQ